MHLDAPFQHRLACGSLPKVEGEVLRDVRDVADACRLQLGEEALVLVGQLLDAVGWLVMDAVGVVFAVVWLGAMGPGSDGGRFVPGEHRAHLPHLGADAVEQCRGFVQDGMQLEQRMDVQACAIVDVAPVQRQHAGFPHVQTGAPQHPQLDGDVQHMDVTGIENGLHLHQPPTPVRQPFQHIGPSKHVLMLERRLEEHRHHAGIKDTPRLRQRLRHMAMVMGDQVPIGIAAAGQFAYFMADVEGELLGLADRRCQMAGVEVPPQAQMALTAD